MLTTQTHYTHYQCHFKCDVFILHLISLCRSLSGFHCSERTHILFRIWIERSSCSMQLCSYINTHKCIHLSVSSATFIWPIFLVTFPHFCSTYFYLMRSSFDTRTPIERNERAKGNDGGKRSCDFNFLIFEPFSFDICFRFSLKFHIKKILVRLIHWARIGERIKN